MYSERLKERLSDKVSEFKNTFDSYEIFLMYARGFHGAVNTHMIRKNFTEVGSPFLDVEFLQMCYEIPVEYRIGHNIYKKWIISKYPEAAKFVWEKTGGTILESKYKILCRKIVKKGPQKVMRLLGKTDAIHDGMNPLDYWIKHNKKLATFLDDYKVTHLNRFKGIMSQELFNDMDYLYKTGNASEKAMVLTVLASIKLYFGDNLNG